MKKHTSDLKQVAPAGVASGVLFPETRSGVGSKTTKSNGAETPFPDQGTGAISGETEIAVFEAWLASEEGRNSQGVIVKPSEFGSRMRYRLKLAFRAGIQAQAELAAPRPQSGAHGDEPEAALRDAIEVANFEAAEWEQAVREFKEAGFTKRERSEYAHKAASLRYAARALATLLPQESRKERSVSGNS